MVIHGSSHTMRVPGPLVIVNCPSCHSVSDAETYEQVEKIAFYFIPLPAQHETCVRCLTCGKIRLSRLPLRDLATLPAADLEPWLYERVSIVAKFMALASLLLACFPIVGLGCGVIGLIMNFKSGGWPRTLCVVGIVINTPITLLGIIAMIMQPSP
jgi:hypothetical protein